MRVTQAMVCREAIRSISENYGAMIKAQERAASGKWRSNPSDDPAAAGTSLYLSTQASRLKGYSRNMENARSRIVQTESAVRDINDAIGSIKDLIIRASKGTLSQTERESICAEIAQYRSQIISSLNASDSGGYMLGGYNTHTPPMTQDEGVLCYNGIELSTMTQEEYSELRAQTIEVNLGQGVTMEASITALDLIGYGSDNLIATLDSITSMLLAEPIDDDALTQLRGNLEEHFDRVLVRLTDIGAREKRLGMIGERLTSSIESVRDRLSANDDIDIEESIIRYKMTLQAYEAALSVSSRSVSTTLLDYLK
ncbi:MAG: hypothetical protein GX549_00995 [Clostridiales bacterium]|nr:hypothetical protein [Clostridiales bacterium]